MLPLDLLQPIGLSELNDKAAMLERLDNKYIVAAPAIREVIERLASTFDVLEIDGRRQFTYETCYFDGPELPCYFDHHQGRRNRIKVRMRSYVEAGLCFVEVKLKDKRGVTIKKRLRHDPSQFGVLDSAAHAHVNSCYAALYRREFPHELTRVLDMRYQRTTLVARQGGERLTIDSDLRFFAHGEECAVNQGMFVIETKSSNGNGLADRVLRDLHQHPTGHCSKYCLGTAVMNTEIKRNKFRIALRKLLGAAAIALAPAV